MINAGYIMEKRSKKPLVLLIFFFLIGVLALASLNVGTACAAVTPEASCTANPDGSDTEEFTIEDIGLITKVVNKIKDKLIPIAPKLFQSITTDSGFLGSLRAAMTLYIAIYGILFMAGIAEIKFHDLIIMFTKLAIVGALLSSTSWSFFDHTVVKFFNDGTDDLINKITAIAVGNSTPVVGSAGAFGAIDSALSKAVSSKMMVTLMANLPVNIYGFLFGAMLAISLFLFLQSIITATWVYVMSMAMKTLLFGLAPIFIPCILFQRTKHLFDGWLSQIVSASIQPILLFVFLSFFISLLDAAMVNLMHTPVCWSKLPDSFRGSPFQAFFWNFMQKDANGNWVPKEGATSDSNNPIDLVAILTFLILAYLANSFNTIVIQISSQISDTVSTLSAENNPVNAIGNKIGGLIAGKK